MNYTVQAGDTLFAIAREKALSIPDIMALNPTLENPNRLREGATVVLPDNSVKRDNRCPGIIMAESPCVKRDEVEPGFHIVERPQSIEALKEHLFSVNLDSDIDAMFARLNPDLGDGVTPGQLVVLGDPRSLQCTEQENQLMQIAQEVNARNAELTYEEAQRTVDYYNLLSAATAGTGTAIGNTATTLKHQTTAVAGKLEDLEKLYQRYYQRTGRLNSREFFDERRRVFRELDVLLDGVTRKGLGIPEHPDLRHALGVSTRSAVHHWRQAGSSAGGIPGYADHYGRIAEVSKWMTRAGYLAVGFSATSTVSNVRAACATGREHECNIARIKEPAAFGGSLAGGAVGGSAGAKAAGPLCLAIGAGTAGVGGLACAVIVVGGGGLIGGMAGGEAFELGGEVAGELIYGGTDE